MKEQLVAVYAEEQEYIYRFSGYLEKKLRLPLRVRSFTEREMLEQFLREETPNILILPEAERDSISASPRTRRFWFSEEPSAEEGALYRYQSMNALTSLLFCPEERTEPETAPAPEPSVLWAVCSPHGGGTEALAYLLAQILAEKESTLFLTLARYSGIRDLLPEERQGSLSDLLYFARVQDDPGPLAAGLTEYVGNLAVVPPAQNRDDLRLAGEEDWQTLLSSLKRTGQFRHIVAELGDGPEDERYVLRPANRILLVSREAPLEKECREAWLEAFKEEALTERIRELRLPSFSEKEEGLTAGELRYSARGRFLCQFIKDNYG